MDRKHRSVSQLKQWDCPQAWKLARIDRVPQLPAAWTSQGLALHGALEYWERSGRLHTIAECQKVFTDTYDQLVDMDRAAWPDLNVWLRGGPTSTLKDIANRRARGIQQVSEYILFADNEGLMTATIDGVPAVEVEVRCDAGGFDILGYIDVILMDSMGNYLIRDYKQSKPEWPLQLYSYGYGLEETFGLKAYWGDFWIAKTGIRSAPIDLEQYDKATLIRSFVEMDEEQKAGHYRAKPGKSCFTCGVKYACNETKLLL